MSRRAVVLSIVVLVAVVPGTVAASPVDGSPVATPVDSSTLATSHGPITNASNATITHGGRTGTAEFVVRNGSYYPQITHNFWLDFGTQVNLSADEYRLRFVDQSTGNAIVYDPQQAATGRYFSAVVYDGDGMLATPSEASANVTATGPVTHRGITSFRAQLIDEDTDTVVSTTGIQRMVIAWTGRAETSISNGTVRVTLDRDFLSRNRTFEARVFEDDVRNYYDTTDRTTVNLTYENATDQFVGTFRESEVDGGSYHMVIETTNSGVEFKYISRFLGGEYWVDRPVVVGSREAKDPNHDGVLEDVNGDGSVSLLDVQALYVERDSPAVQNNTEGFDADFDGSFDLLDVQRLFERVTGS